MQLTNGRDEKEALGKLHVESVLVSNLRFIQDFDPDFLAVELGADVQFFNFHLSLGILLRGITHQLRR